MVSRRAPSSCSAGAGKRRAARWSLAGSSLAACVLCLTRARAASAQGFARAGEGGAGDDVPAPPPFVPTERTFSRATNYPYRVCKDLPGNIGEDGASYRETYKRAKCVPIEAGELEFCGQVSYDACVRIQEYWRFDNLVSMQYDAVVQDWTDRLTENGQEALLDPGCPVAFQDYFCHAAFPRCYEGDVENEYWELPLCFDYCVKANAACIGNPEAAKRVCRTHVETGRVSPEGRDDILCSYGGDV